MKTRTILNAILMLAGVCLLSACASSAALNNSASWPGLTAEGNTVYLANSGQISAVEDGSLLWSYPASAERNVMFYAAPAVGDSAVYAGSYSNRLYILDKTDGALIRDIEVGNAKNKVIASPVLTENSVIVLSSGGTVTSYALEGGNEKQWETTLSGEVWTKAISESGKLYVASMDKKLNVLDESDGTLLDSIEMSGAILSDPVVMDGKIYFSTLASEVDELDPALEGDNIRVLLRTKGEIWGSPLLMGDKLVAADMAGNVYCVNIADGSEVWTANQVTEHNAGFIASPVALDDETFALVAEEGTMMIFGMDGKSIMDRSLGNKEYSTPAVLESGSIAVAPLGSEAEIKAFTSPELKEDWVYIPQSDKSKSDDAEKKED